MTTHKTLNDARLAAKTNSEIRSIVEIEHATEGHRYIGIRTQMAGLAIALKSTPMPEIKRLIAEHPILTAEEVKTARENALRERIKCERCAKNIDGNTAYSQQERYMGHTVTAWYCDSCRALLAGIGAGEFTALQELAGERASYEPYTKEDF